MHRRLPELFRSMFAVDWSQFEAVAALRCTIGVAVPLLVGLAIQQPLVGVFGAAGAVGVGFGSFQGAYRGRAGLMLLAATAMAFSVFVGSLAGHSDVATVGVAALWAFVGGLLVALGRGASFVGLQSMVAIVIAGGYPSDFGGAAVRAALVLIGGLIQTFLVVVVWPLRRFAVERRSLAGAYRTLAAYTLTIPAQDAMPPEPHTFAGTASPLADPQPFAKSGQPFIFQGLLDEAERIRASLAALTIRYPRLAAADPKAAKALIDALSEAIAELAAALEDGRAPREPPGFSRTLAGGIGRLSSDTLVEPLLGQIRAAWRTAGMLTADSEHLAPRRELVAARRRRVAIRDGLITLRANLSPRSTACRHALRLAVVLALAAAAARTFDLARGYWLPLTIALVLKPDFHDTFTFTSARVAGTVLGAAGATAIGVLFAPSPIALIALVLVFVWAAYGFGIANYGAFSACITAYVVFLMTLAGIPEVTAATDRIIYTVLAGALAACAYVVWPTWTAMEARPAVAAMLEAQSGYVGALLAAYANPSHADLRTLDEMRASARLARSNSEATVERMLGEPRSRYTIDPRTAVGVVGATRRNALAALSLHAGLERDHLPGVPDIVQLASEVESSLSRLASAVRQGEAPRALPQLREIQRVLGDSHDVIRDETDLLVDSVDTIAELLVTEAALGATGAQGGSPARASRP